MELVSLHPGIPRSRRSRRTSSREEPLLSDDNDQFLDEWLSTGRYSSSRRHRREQRRRGRRPLSDLHAPIVPASRYQPPSLTDSNIVHHAQENGLAVPDYARVPQLYFNGPAPPSASRALRRQTPTRTTRRMNRQMTSLKHNNPAVDRGGFFSYGLCCMQCVRTQEVGATETFGQFQEILGPGFYCMLWPFSDIAGRLSLRIQQIDVGCETKTKDNVFLHIKVSVQFQVLVEKAFDAYYRLTDPSLQIKSYVFDVIRSTVPRMTVDEVFVSKTTIATSVWKRLHGVMQDYGYKIIQTLVTDICPDPLVKASMNEMNASKRLKEARPHQAEAGEQHTSTAPDAMAIFNSLLGKHSAILCNCLNVEKTKIVKAAEASAEAMYLSGVGSARERIAVAKGMKDCVSTWLVESGGVSYKDVMDLLLVTQYLDTLAAVGATSGTSLNLRDSPGEVFDIQESLPRKKEEVPDLLW